jgi:hypothetical protein
MAGDSSGQRPFKPGSGKKKKRRKNEPQPHKYVHQPRRESQTEQTPASQNVQIQNFQETANSILCPTRQKRRDALEVTANIQRKKQRNIPESSGIDSESSDAENEETLEGLTPDQLLARLKRVQNRAASFSTLVDKAENKAMDLQTQLEDMTAQKEGFKDKLLASDTAFIEQRALTQAALETQSRLLGETHSLKLTIEQLTSGEPRSSHIPEHSLEQIVDSPPQDTEARKFSENMVKGGQPTKSDSDSDSDDSNAKSDHIRSRHIRVPPLHQWGGGNGSEEESVRIFLPRLAQYLEAQGISQNKLHQHVGPFLKGKAFELWALQCQTYISSDTPVTWDLFAKFMTKTFGAIAPERQARLKYDKLTQQGSVFSYITETKKLVQLMRPMKMICPGEAEIISHFVDKAKPNLQIWLTTRCLPDYWADSEQLFDEAIMFATNLASNPTTSKSAHPIAHRAPPTSHRAFGSLRSMGPRPNNTHRGRSSSTGGMRHR